MSEGYASDRALVSGESTIYDRALDVTIALTGLSFLLGVLTLVKVVPLDLAGVPLAEFTLVLLGLGVGGIATIAVGSWLHVVAVTSERVRGIGMGVLVGLVGLTVLANALEVTLATLIGVVLLAEAAVVCLAGIASFEGLVDTEPSPSAGLLAGAAFGGTGLLVGAALAGTFLPGGTVGTAASALAVGLGFAVVSIVPREDLGTGLPAALLVGLLGLVIVSGAIDLGWTYSPGEYVDGDVTGEVAVPLFALLGSIVAGWSAAKARAGYGARGRQYGAYLVVYLNATLTVVVMCSIVIFVVMKGFTYAAHGVSIGALSAIVLLVPPLLLSLEWARTPAGTDEWHGAARQFLRLVPLAVVGSLVGVLAVLQVTGTELSVPFTFTVLENREPVVLDTTAALTTDLLVGNLVVVLVGLVCFAYLLRKPTALRGAGRSDPRLVTLERLIGLAVGAILVIVLLVALPLPESLTADGLPLGLPVWILERAAATLAGPIAVGIPVGAMALALLAALPLLVGNPATAADRAVERAQFVRVGLYGALALLAGAVILSGIESGPEPAGVPLVPAVAGVTAVAGLAISLTTAWAARGVEDRTRRICRRESVVGLATAAGAVTAVGLYVVITGESVSIGPLTIGVRGTLDWPMTMQPYVPLGAQPGGILPAVVGTVWLVIGASLFAIPLGLGAAVFLTEYAEQGRLTSTVEVATNALWSTPSIVFGLFAAAFLIPRLGGDESLVSGMLVLGFMLLPLVLITSREAVKAVPDEYRDASAALGVSRWETIKSVVVPAAMPGVITGGILGVGRIAGETASLLLVLGSTLNATEAKDVLGGFEFVGHPPFVENPVLFESAAALPTQVWAVIAAGVSGSPWMGWASALVLLLVVLSFYAVGIAARTYFRRKLNYE